MFSQNEKDDQLEKKKEKLEKLIHNQEASAVAEVLFENVVARCGAQMETNDEFCWD